MTDKQIIIDGCDVSGCEYHSLNKNNCSLCSLSNNLICSYKPFCYYKQLKAKEQECEEYAKINEQETKDYAELWKQHDQLKQTLVEIKEIITTALEKNTLINLDKILQKINEVEDES